MSVHNNAMKKTIRQMSTGHWLNLRGRFDNTLITQLGGLLLIVFIVFPLMLLLAVGALFLRLFKGKSNDEV